MKCEEFHERLNDCLDAGLQPSRDRELHRHCLRCRECRRDLETWQWIAHSVGPYKEVKAKVTWRAAVPLGLAAGLCLIVLGYLQQPGEMGVAANRPVAAELPVVANRPAVAELPKSAEMKALVIAPAQWSDPKWVDRWADQMTEPLVPLSQGLAPLGRSFQTAFTLLVLPAEGRKAEVRPIAQPLQSKVFSLLPEVSYA